MTPDPIAGCFSPEQLAEFRAAISAETGEPAPVEVRPLILEVIKNNIQTIVARCKSLENLATTLAQQVGSLSPEDHYQVYGFGRLAEAMATARRCVEFSAMNAATHVLTPHTHTHEEPVQPCSTPTN